MIERLTIAANGLRFPALATGQGPLVILLHGFPDSPDAFAAQLPALSAAGFRAVAPCLRGYAPEAQPADGDYHVDRLAADLLAIADELGADRFHLIGHDLGATTGYAAAALAPERLRSFAALTVPHPARFAEVSATRPEQLACFQYILDFQAADAEARVAADDFAYLVDLWRRWSPGWVAPHEALAGLRRTFGAPGVTAAALAFYRQAIDAASPAGQRAQALLAGPFATPTLGLCGAEDGCILADTFVDSMPPADFPAGVAVRRVGGAGHFLHRERPDAVNALLIGWLRDQQR